MSRQLIVREVNMLIGSDNNITGVFTGGYCTRDVLYMYYILYKRCIL